MLRGSSPLARGLPISVWRLFVRSRIIPARAGFTGPQGRRSRNALDHPRSRGVYAKVNSDNLTAEGSSPLARGLRRSPTKGLVCMGIIPARAGFTDFFSVMLTGMRDHPRSRGVYDHSRAQIPVPRGSSPLARGLPLHVREHGQIGGIIPARAGFTRGYGWARRASRDHPRSRGVYWPAILRPPGRRGSSPLARGLRAGLRQVLGERGIIPARAGFTHHHEPVGDAHADHPRSRGVYRRIRPAWEGPSGSSPLARGLPLSWARPPGSVGIIPARAGFTTHHPVLYWSLTDHPRSRGVYPGM